MMLKENDYHKIFLFMKNFSVQLRVKERSTIHAMKLLN